MEHIIKVRPENAARVWDWLLTRGGVALWPSVNLSNANASWTTPALDEHGQPTKRPNWQACSTPKIVTDPVQCAVVEKKLVATLRIAVRLGSQGLTLKLTDASSRRVNHALLKAGNDAWYEFGGLDGLDCHIYVPNSVTPIAEYAAAHRLSK